MKQECPTYLKTIGKSKTLVAMLSNTEPEDDGILNAFTATINPNEGIVKDVDEEEDLVSLRLKRWMSKMTSTQFMQN